MRAVTVNSRTAGLVVMAAAFMLPGCVVPQKTTQHEGRDFATQNISEIRKGTTSATDIRILLGEPLRIDLLSITEERWVYGYRTTTAVASGRTAQSQSYEKRLVLLLSEDVVINFTYSDGPVPFSGKSGPAF